MHHIFICDRNKNVYDNAKNTNKLCWIVIFLLIFEKGWNFVDPRNLQITYTHFKYPKKGPGTMYGPKISISNTLWEHVVSKTSKKSDRLQDPVPIDHGLRKRNHKFVLFHFRYGYLPSAIAAEVTFLVSRFSRTIKTKHSSFVYVVSRICHDKQLDGKKLLIPNPWGLR